MKRKTYVILLIIGFLLASCSPETVKQMPKEEIEESSTMAVATASGSSLEIRFKPVAFAKAYAYSIGDDEIREGITPGYENGYYTFKADIAGMSEGSVTIYASTEADGEDWKVIAMANFVTTLKGVPLDAYVSRRNETEAEIRINTNLSPEVVEYRISLDGNVLDSSRYEIDDHVITLNGITADQTYNVKIQHALSSNSNFDENESAELTIGPYDANISSDMDLNVSTDKKFFEISNVPSDVTTLDLYKRESANSTKSILIYRNIRVENGKARIPFSSLNSLESGYFYVHGLDSGSKIHVSNILKYTTPLMLINKTVNYKSIDLEFGFADDIDTASLTFSIAGAAGAGYETKGSTVRITGLDSNTSYEKLRIKPADSEYSLVDSIIIERFSTKSFAGKSYEWVGFFKGETWQTNFSIHVSEAKEGSSYPYYVHFSEDDAVFTDSVNYEKDDISYTEQRIMPLVDTSVGEPEVSASSPVNTKNVPENLKAQNSAYLANSKKWNSMGVTPDSWYVFNGDTNPQKDIVTTQTRSKASIMSDAPTETTFSFMEYEDGNDMKPVIKFRNYSDSFFVRLGLYANSNSKEGKIYGDSTGDEYCFYLTERKGN